MLHHALGESSSSSSTNHVKLKAVDKSSAGDNDVFLNSKLRWDKGKDGRERVLDEDRNG